MGRHSRSRDEEEREEEMEWAETRPAMATGWTADDGRKKTRAVRLNRETVKLLRKMKPDQLLDRLTAIELGEARAHAKRRRSLVSAKDAVDRYRRDPAPILLCLSMLLPTVDSLLDWAVTVNLFFSDNPAYLMSFAVQLVSGYFMGVVFVFSLLEEGGLARIGFAVLGGIAGMVPAAIVLSAFCTETGTVRESRSAVVPYLAVQLLLEAVPQAVLQSYLGITEGMIDGGSEAYSPLLVLSIVVSVFSAGVGIFSIDTRLRSEIDFVLRYAVIAIAGYTATATALVFWAALMACAFKAAIFWLVLMVVFFCCFGCITTRCVGADMLVRWAAQKREQRKTQKVNAADGVAGEGRVDDGEDGLEGVEEQSQAAAVEVKLTGKRREALWLLCGFVSFLIMLLLMSTIFSSVEHARNNYANTSALAGAPGGVSVDNPTGDSYLSCAELPVGNMIIWDVATTATVVSVILAMLGWVVDPVLGIDYIRPKPCPLRSTLVSSRCVSNYTVIFSLEILDLYWDSLLFRDVFCEGFLGPQEIYRLAEVLNIGYDRVCYELGVRALTERQLDDYFRTEGGRKKLSPREREVLLQAVVRASIDERQFVANPPKPIHRWFDDLRLMVKN